MYFYHFVYSIKYEIFIEFIYFRSEIDLQVIDSKILEDFFDSDVGICCISVISICSE